MRKSIPAPVLVVPASAVLSSPIHHRALECFPKYPTATLDEVVAFFTGSAKDAPSLDFLKREGHLEEGEMYDWEEALSFPVAASSFAPVPFGCISPDEHLDSEEDPRIWWPNGTGYPSTVMEEVDGGEDEDVVEVEDPCSFTTYELWSMHRAPFGTVFGRVTCTGTIWVFRLGMPTEDNPFGPDHVVDAFVKNTSTPSAIPAWAYEWIAVYGKPEDHVWLREEQLP